MPVWKRTSKVKTNWYSLPLWPGLRVTALVWPLSIEIRRDGECVAQHPRCYGRGHQILNLEHYLDVLEKKPGAMAGSTPLEQWRLAGRWPECLDRIWHQLEQRHGKSVGTREMITLVRAGSGKSWDQLIAAVEEALRLGVTDAAAVLHILNMPDPEQRRRYALDLADELLFCFRPLLTRRNSKTPVNRGFPRPLFRVHMPKTRRQVIVFVAWTGFCARTNEENVPSDILWRLRGGILVGTQTNGATL